MEVSVILNRETRKAHAWSSACNFTTKRNNGSDLEHCCLVSATGNQCSLCHKVVPATPLTRRGSRDSKCRCSVSATGSVAMCAPVHMALWVDSALSPNAGSLTGCCDQQQLRFCTVHTCWQRQMLCVLGEGALSPMLATIPLA